MVRALFNSERVGGVLKSCSMDPDVDQNFIDRLVRIEELEGNNHERF